MNTTHYTHTADCEGLCVQYDLCFPDNHDQKVTEFETAYHETLGELGRLTNTADGVDYAVAAASGIVAGIIDVLWVGEFSIERANQWGNKQVEKFVVKVAQMCGYGGDDLAGAVKYLEENFPIAADKATHAFGGGFAHHLRDFSHHPTPVGLIFSMLTQFTSNVYGTDVAGHFLVVLLKEENDLVLLGKNLPEKLIFGVINWVFHMVSDMAGSYGSIVEGKVGTGLPGPIVSLLKEISALPIFRKMNENGYKEFSVWISKLFNGTLLGRRNASGNVVEPIKFDLRTEIGVAHELGRQALPVVVNECVVRAFYFIRRLFSEIKENEVRRIGDLHKVNWKNTLPIKNRTIVRMLTISTGVMEVIDLADAAVRSGGNIGMFVLRVNYVGVVRFAVAGSTDWMMGVRKARLELAMASAETAKTAQVAITMIRSVERQKAQTQENLDRLTEEVNKTAQLKF